VPLSIGDFIEQGGMYQRDAAAAAIRAEQESWLPVLEAAMLNDFQLQAYLLGQIKRLRHTLGIKPTLKERRAQTRERGRRWRKRQKNARRPAA
jgi:hypothetical protein